MNNQETDQKDTMNETDKLSVINGCNVISGIYKIVNKIDGKYYVGSAVDLHRRWKSHVQELNGKRHHNSKLLNAWYKHGKDNFDFIFVETVDPVNKILLEVEQKYLDIAKNEQDKSYNLNFIASGGFELSEDGKERKRKALTGLKRTDETKRKIGLSSSQRRGENHWNYGKKMKPESLERMRKSLTGRPLSDECKRKISAAGLGRKMSPESIEKCKLAALKRWELKRAHS